jgi:hypothetical protein
MLYQCVGIFLIESNTNSILLQWLDALIYGHFNTIYPDRTGQNSEDGLFFKDIIWFNKGIKFHIATNVILYVNIRVC